MRFSTLFNLSTIILAGISYAADKHLFILREQPGEDGKYHWRMLLGTKDPLGGTWHDVVWSDNIDIGMRHRSKEWRANKSKDAILGIYDLGSIKSQSEDKLLQVARSTPTPKYGIADKEKNCQTWVEDVVRKLVGEEELPKTALEEMNRVPKQEPRSPGSSSSPKSDPGSPKSDPGSPKSAPGSPKAVPGSPKSAPGSPKAKSPSPASPRKARSLRRAHLARAITEAIKLAVREVEMDAFVARMEIRNHWD
ncbi:hypothetical protein DXG01_010752 [Tephrocybe rancida]|nr:hypothetical protein DXG01_010752 [Tephrocybe rancida]